MTWLLQVVDLFDGVFNAIMDVPVLAFFLSTELFFVVSSCLLGLASFTRRRRL